MKQCESSDIHLSFLMLISPVHIKPNFLLYLIPCVHLPNTVLIKRCRGNVQIFFFFNFGLFISLNTMKSWKAVIWISYLRDSIFTQDTLLSGKHAGSTCKQCYGSIPMFLGLLDPDPLVRGMDPIRIQIWILLSPSKNSKKNLDS